MTDKSTVSCDYHDESKDCLDLVGIKHGIKVRFVAGRLEQFKKFLVFTKLKITQRSKQVKKNNLYFYDEDKKCGKKC